MPTRRKAEAALKWLENENNWNRGVIVCDRKSLVEATGNPHNADPIIVTLQRSIARIICSKKLIVVWVPGHCNLWGDELADSKAKRGSTLPQPAERHLNQKTRKTVIHREDHFYHNNNHRPQRVATSAGTTTNHSGPFVTFRSHDLLLVISLLNDT